MNKQNNIDEQRRIILEYLKNYIRKNKLCPGDKLPSQNSLVMQFHTNRNTVRSVFSTLKAQGLVYSEKGCGFFVSEKPNTFLYTYDNCRGFSENIQQKDETYENRMVSIIKRKATNQEMKLFQLEEEENVFCLTTERSLHNDVFAIGKQILPERYVPDLDQYLDNFHSINDLLMDVYGYDHPICKKLTIEACLPHKEEITLMHLQDNMPILKQTEIFSIDNIGYISCFTVWIRGDAFKFRMEFD